MEDFTEDLSRLALSVIPERENVKESCSTKNLILHHNNITSLPQWFSCVYSNITRLDISNNDLHAVPQEVFQLTKLQYLLLKNNRLSIEFLPKDWGALAISLEGINLSGNPLESIPDIICEQLMNLKYLYLGSCRIRNVQRKICQLQKLELLYLGGNYLAEVPAELGLLSYLSCLVLSDNRLESLPATLGQLKNLQSLSLHNNKLQMLPPEIVSLTQLVELSLRQNPLVVKFVRMGLPQWQVPSLLELAGRTVRFTGMQYDTTTLPTDLVNYLDSAHHCVNPDCRGVYFTSRVEHVKFVDFCGKYRLPLLQFLCSPSCTDSSECYSSTAESSSGETSDDEENQRVRRVLLG